MSEMASFSPITPVFMAKNMAEELMAWSLKAARNWAAKRPMKVRVHNLSEA